MDKDKKEDCSCSSNSGCCPPNRPAIKVKAVQSSANPPLQVESIPTVPTVLSASDIGGMIKARLNINRMNYKVMPGLYRAGKPDSTSPVLVTANYKMTFDLLRKELDGLDAWILVLDTKGINVWCAAGKGTFGTDELVGRIEAVGLAQFVTHRTLILPQLGAPGIAAHEVQQRSGFQVIYGPVRASDIKEFIRSGLKATPQMRTVQFGFFDRLLLVPVELVATYRIFIPGLLFLMLLQLFTPSSYGIKTIVPFIGAILTGCVLVPLLLPWIPGRSFAFKGWLLGFFWTGGVLFYYGWPTSSASSWLQMLSYLLLLPSVASFLALNFTGSSTYTSLSGVQKEMKFAIPATILASVVGLILAVTGSFMKV